MYARARTRSLGLRLDGSTWCTGDGRWMKGVLGRDEGGEGGEDGAACDEEADEEEETGTGAGTGGCCSVFHVAQWPGPGVGVSPSPPPSSWSSPWALPARLLLRHSGPHMRRMRRKMRLSAGTFSSRKSVTVWWIAESMNIAQIKK